jgi:hypothetical protein
MEIRISEPRVLGVAFYRQYRGKNHPRLVDTEKVSVRKNRCNATTVTENMLRTMLVLDLSCVLPNLMNSTTVDTYEHV